MYVRCAYFEGDVAKAQQPRFRTLVIEQLASGMANYPNVRQVRVLWGDEFEAEDRKFYLVIEHAYDSPADLNIALQSDVRASAQPAIDEINTLFRGRIFHVNYETDN